MGFLDLFTPKTETPTVPSVLPDQARSQILSGILPNLLPDNLLLKKGEVCHYADRAIYEKRIVDKRRVRKSTGYSVPGLFSGTRVHFGGSEYENFEDIKYRSIKGILYITSERVVFVGGEDGFDRKVKDLVAVKPYANCIELQFTKGTLRLFVPDGSLPDMVLHMIS